MMNVTTSSTTSTAVSFDGSEEERTSHHRDYDFNDLLPLHDDDADMEDTESESVVLGAQGGRINDHFLDPHTNLVTLDWETSPPVSLLPDCLFDLEAIEDAFVDSTLEPTEVSQEDGDEDTDFDSASSSLEHRFEETAKRLAESMKKSRRTRVSLTLKSPAVAHYLERRTSISSVVSSVEESSHQLLRTFRARGAGRSGRPLHTLRALRSSRAGRALRTGGPDRALRSGVTLVALRPLDFAFVLPGEPALAVGLVGVAVAGLVVDEQVSDAARVGSRVG